MAPMHLRAVFDLNCSAFSQQLSSMDTSALLWGSSVWARCCLILASKTAEVTARYLQQGWARICPHKADPVLWLKTMTSTSE